MTIVAMTSGDFVEVLGRAMAVMFLTLVGSGLLWILWRASPNMPKDSSTIRRVIAGIGVGYFSLAVLPHRPDGPRGVDVLGTVLGVTAVLVLEAIELAVIASRRRRRDAMASGPRETATTEVGPTSARDDHPTE